MQNNVKAVIMAGGVGRRLRPITEGMPKPMVPIVAEPCINHIINLLQKYGINDIAVTTMYKGEVISENIKASFPSLNIRVYREEKPLGTAGSVSFARDFLDGDFIVISGDSLCDAELDKAVDFHRQKGGIATVLLSEADDPTEYGIVLTDDEDKVVRFIEKPDWSRACATAVNTGIYIFSKRIFDYIPENTFFDFSGDVFPSLLKAGEKIYATRMDFYWKDIGNPTAYLEANIDMVRGVVPRNNDKKNYIAEHGRAKIIPPCFIDSDCDIGDAQIGPNTIIGKGCVIADGARITDSVIMRNIFVDAGSYLRKTVICDNSRIGKEVSVGEESVIGRNCEIGDSCIVSSGAVIYNDIVFESNSRISGRNMVLRGSNEISSGKLVFDERDSLFDALKWGYSYGKAVEGNIAFAFPEKAYSAFAQTFSSAVRDSGDNVYLLCETDFSGLKYIVRNFGFQGGVYMRREAEGVVLNFIDEDGLFLSSSKVKEMQKIYDSEDFRTGNGGRLKVFNGFAIGYQHHLERLFDGISDFPATVIAPSSVTNLIHFSHPAATEKFCVTDDRLRVFRIENGEDAEYSKLEVSLVCLYVFGKTKGKVFIPENFPSVAEDIAKNNNFTVTRIGWDKLDRYLLYSFTDPISCLSAVLKYLSDNKTTFGEILRKIPQFYREEKRVSVDGGQKARIISSMSLSPGCTLLENGIRISFPEKKSVVSVISSADKKNFRIYAESVSRETAEELCDIYVNKIKMESKKVKNDTSK
ncbi:MAG: NTP transferase domain-containing protein [Clostridiales bacterium]|nr:NTP transferase domain-containing protein [Clostridiales bacterium]